MKTKLLILFLLSGCICQAQDIFYTPEKTFWEKIPKSAKVITINLTAITLNAIGDAWIAQDKNRDIAHIFNAASIGITLTAPWICDIEKGDWLAYIGSYVTLRIAIFDPIYNVARGQQWNQRHDASYWDKGINQFNPPAGIEAFGRGMFFIVGITIPITEL